MFTYAPLEQKHESKSSNRRREPENRNALPNQTGIPNNMKTRFENLSGFSFDDVRVHYNSDKPAQLQALAYTQGNQVYVASGQEKHLEHELGHVTQQKQNRVQPTKKTGHFQINDDMRLETEADSLARETIQMQADLKNSNRLIKKTNDAGGETIQMATQIRYSPRDIHYLIGGHDLVDRVGMETEAMLDPSDPQMGTEVGATTGIYHTYGLVQGHLLNAKLGGQAEAQNLFPISNSLNHYHSGFEMQAKILYTELNQEYKQQYMQYQQRNLEILQWQQNGGMVPQNQAFPPYQIVMVPAPQPVAIPQPVARRMHYKVSVQDTGGGIYTSSANLTERTSLHCQYGIEGSPPMGMVTYKNPTALDIPGVSGSLERVVSVGKVSADVANCNTIADAKRIITYIRDSGYALTPAMQESVNQMYIIFDALSEYPVAPVNWQRTLKTMADSIPVSDPHCLAYNACTRLLNRLLG